MTRLTSASRRVRALPLRAQTFDTTRLQANLPRRPIARGEAMIFWDPKTVGTPTPQKLGNINTDYIIPSVDCVSYELDDIDGPWAKGIFRQLRPTFHAELKDGKTFVVAGTGFGTGSSREMAVIGMLRAAKDAGQDGNLVIVCGSDIGDIFRKNAINGGLHVVQSDKAVADAQDGDKFEFDPNTRTLNNVTQGKLYREGQEILPFTPAERTIYLSGGMLGVYKTLDFPNGRRRKPPKARPDATEYDRMSVAQRILALNRVFPGEVVEPGKSVHVRPHMAGVSDGTAPHAIWVWNQFTGGNRDYPPLAIAIGQDHYDPSYNNAYARNTQVSTDFAARWGIRHPWFTGFGEGIIHFVWSRNGLVVPGTVAVGADSHSTTAGAYGAYGVGVGSSEVGMAIALGYFRLPVLANERITFKGQLGEWVTGKDVILRLTADRRVGDRYPGAEGRAVEYHDPGMALSAGMRHTVANMGPEFNAPVSIFVHDGVTDAFMEHIGVARFPHGVVTPGPNAQYVRDDAFDLNGLVPMVARPFHPGASVPAEEVAREQQFIDQAAIGSCTEGTIDAMLMGALVIHMAQKGGAPRVAAPNRRSGTGNVQFVVTPGSHHVERLLDKPHPLLEGHTPREVYVSANAIIAKPSCQNCFLAESRFGLGDHQVAVNTFNRNWKGRQGTPKSRSFLANPYIVAASALLGHIGTPSDLGLTWGAPFTELEAA